uniref:Uncharacterized protein n=1 Tax=Desertifilum tharense IPPAS B-1220 TaxID=1781255 RepID=A0ACD5H050_9CYAN
MIQYSIIHDEVLFPTTEVSYWGQAIVWTVGETEEAARLAAEKVVVEYEPLEPILTIESAIAANSFHNQPQVIKHGNPLEALQESEYRLQGEVLMNGQDHFYLETHTSWYHSRWRRSLSNLFFYPTPLGNSEYCCRSAWGSD